MSDYQAIIARETEDGFLSEQQTQALTDLPDNEVLIEVKYSTLNFKDALSAAGNKGHQKLPTPIGYRCRRYCEKLAPCKF